MRDDRLYCGKICMIDFQNIKTLLEMLLFFKVLIFQIVFVHIYTVKIAVLKKNGKIYVEHSL